MNAERQRLAEARSRAAHWKRWGPYLSERAWGTVREDYSPCGTAWDYLPHDHARSKTYRWNEDGIAGISDRHQNQACMFTPGMGERRLMSIVDGGKLRRVLRYMLDENEFLSPYGIRA